jgi:hypothetical protein
VVSRLQSEAVAQATAQARQAQEVKHHVTQPASPMAPHFT